MEAAKEGLRTSKALHQSLTDVNNGTATLDVPSALKQVRLLNKIINELHKQLKTIERKQTVNAARRVAEYDCLRSAMHCELVDREANAARISDRQRFLWERSNAQAGQASAAERAGASAAYVEFALASLCPHVLARSAGCDQLALPQHKTTNE